MRRRKFIEIIAGSVAAWPLSVYAQQAGSMRRVGFLNSLAESDPEARKEATAFRQVLQQLGWTEGQNFQIEYRWGAGDGDRIRKNAAEMAALAPDVVLASGASVPLMLQATQTVPTVFVLAIDPVADGLVNSLAHPGGNATGFTLFEFSLSGKWLELLKDAAPAMTLSGWLRCIGCRQSTLHAILSLPVA